MNVEGYVSSMIHQRESGEMKIEELATIAFTLLTYILTTYEPGPAVDRWLDSIPTQLRIGMELANGGHQITHQFNKTIN